MAFAWRIGEWAAHTGAHVSSAYVQRNNVHGRPERRVYTKPSSPHKTHHPMSNRELLPLRAKWQVLIDFDGTVAPDDPTDRLLERFADPLWRVVEAMKMENILRAERDGIVKAIKAKPGDSLAVDAVIMEFV